LVSNFCNYVGLNIFIVLICRVWLSLKRVRKTYFTLQIISRNR
jgi:hypothetical protein